MYAFIGGIPVAGKTTLAKKIINSAPFEIFYGDIDHARKNWALEDPKLAKWVDFFRHQDETAYWQKTNCQQHMQNVVRQSKALWPLIFETIKQTCSMYKHAIFDGVNILPELAHQDLNIPGIFLVISDIEIIYQRLQKKSRWGKTDELKKIEAKCFYEGESEFIKSEAKKYGYKVFDNPLEAEVELKNIFKIKICSKETNILK